MREYMVDVWSPVEAERADQVPPRTRLGPAEFTICRWGPQSSSLTGLIFRRSSPNAELAAMDSWQCQFSS